MFPVIPLLTGVALIAFALPNRRPQGRVKLDIPGIAALTVALSGLLLGLNFGPRVGWMNPWVLAGFAVGIFALFILIKVERKSEEPLIPLHLFGNSRYNLLLAKYRSTSLRSKPPNAASIADSTVAITVLLKISSVPD